MRALIAPPRVAFTALVGLSLAGCLMVDEYPEGAPYISGAGFVVSVEKARSLYLKGRTTFLDTRPAAAYASEHLKGSFHADWRQLADPKDPLRGRLLSDEKLLVTRLRALGLSRSRSVVVLGDAAGGWGEEGRIVWLLRTLGHPDAALLDGGFAALSASDLPLTAAATAAGAGDFTIKRDSRWEISRDQLQALIKGGGVAGAGLVLVDSREKREYDGAVPYGEQRGGHVPGAVHFHYKQLVNAGGKLWDRTTLLARLKAAGLTPDKQVVIYCTGGVRSGWLVMVLADLGFASVRNYAGSMWEWSAGPAEQFPLQKK